jgi:hypothetical protein
MRFNRTLWTIQVLLAALFLFSGSMKLILPADQLSGPVALSPAFLRFIGTAEVLGAMGLVLPWLFGIRRVLTPIAAGALLIIMIGAVAITVIGGNVAGASVPAIVGMALVGVAYGRGPAVAV